MDGRERVIKTLTFDHPKKDMVPVTSVIGEVTFNILSNPQVEKNDKVQT